MKNEDVNFVDSKVSFRGQRSIILRKWATLSAEVVLRFRGLLHRSFVESAWNPCRISAKFIGFRKVSCDKYCIRTKTLP